MTADRDRLFTVMLVVTLVLTLVFASLVVADLTHNPGAVAVTGRTGAPPEAGSASGTPAPPSAIASPGAQGTPSASSATARATARAAGQAPGTGAAGGPVADTGHGNGEILLGSIVTQTGPGRSITMAHAITAWARAVNQAGGIAGNRIQLDLRDDGGNTDTGAGEYRQFAEGEKVFALVGECAPVTDATQVDYVNQQHLVLVGECESSPQAYQSPSIWVTGPTPLQNGQLAAKLVLTLQHWPQSGGKIAEICLDEQVLQATCSGAAGSFGSGALFQGAPIKEPITANDYGSLISQFRSAGVGYVDLVLDPGSVQRYLYAAEQSQFIVPVMNDLVIDDGIAANPQIAQAANNEFMGTAWTPLNESTPGMQRLTSTLQTYFPDDRVDVYAQTGWLNCLLMEHALQLMGSDVSKQRLIDTLNAIRGWDSGLGPVETYSPQNHVGQLENALMQLHDAGGPSYHLDGIGGPIGL